MLNTDTVPDSEIVHARQHAMLWNEEHWLDTASGQRLIPLNTIYNVYADELPFPSIYYGVGRQFKDSISMTPYMLATSETRRTGEDVLVEVEMPNQFKFVLVSVYIHPQTQINYIEYISLSDNALLHRACQNNS
jgi:hypothetical protein